MIRPKSNEWIGSRFYCKLYDSYVYWIIFISHWKFTLKIQYPGRDFDSYPYKLISIIEEIEDFFLLECFEFFSLFIRLWFKLIFKLGICNYRMPATTFSIRTEEVCLTLWKTHLPTPKVPSLCKTERYSSLSSSLPLTSLPQLCVWICRSKVGGRSQLFWVGYCIWAVCSEVKAKHSVSENRGFWNVWVTILKLPVQNTFLMNYLKLNFNAP